MKNKELSRARECVRTDLDLGMSPNPENVLEPTLSAFWLGSAHECARFMLEMLPASADFCRL